MVTFADGTVVGALVAFGTVIAVKVLVRMGDKPKEDIQEFPSGSFVFYSNWENKVIDCKIIQYLGNHRYIIDHYSYGLQEVSGNCLHKINKLDVKA